MALTNLMTAITLDVYDHNATQTSIKSISCDSNTRFVRAALTYAHVPYKVSVGAAVALTVVRPDGAAVNIEGEAYNSGAATTDRIVAELTDVATAVKGSLLAQFKIEDGNQVLRTEVFKIDNGVALDIDSDKWADTYQGYDLSEFNKKLSAMQTATSKDVGKALLAKRVVNGEVTEWEFGKTSDKSSGDAFTQWRGKTWYAYGTSITNIASEGRYATYLAQMSGMTLVNKGISGGGIGNFGSYSKGEVYSAICNTTDGKTNADLITLETGANDVDPGIDVPLGTVYDTGTSTLAGCLNDCLRYLQTHTNAQIVVLPSPAFASEDPCTLNVKKYYDWAKMVEEICNINRVSFINSNNNMGYAKLASNYGSDYKASDGVHQSDLGGRIFAQHIWYQLRNIPPFEYEDLTPEPEDKWTTTYNGSLTIVEFEEYGQTYNKGEISSYNDTLKLGTDYRITYNGTLYECSVEEDSRILYIGNALWGGGPTSSKHEPFVLMADSGAGILNLYCGESIGSTVTVKIEKHTGSSPTPQPVDNWQTLFNGSLTVQDLEEYGMHFNASYINNFSGGQLTEGDNYRVTFNGTGYLCTVGYDTNANVCYLGNRQWSGGDTSSAYEPFVLLNEGNNTLSVFTNETVGSTFTLKIEKRT